MQGMNPGQGGTQGGNRQGGLSWSSPQGSQGNAQTSPLLSGQKPTQSTSSAVAPKPVTTAMSKPTPRISTDNSTARTAGLFVAGMIIGALLMWGWNVMVGSSNPTTTATTTPNVATGNNTANTSGAATTNTKGNVTTPATTASGDLEIGAQDAGLQIMVTDTTVSEPTWLVVYELSQGVPVRALGATMFFPAYNGKGGIISLVRATQPNTTYFVGTSLDTGDHTFTPHVNKEVLDSSGRMVGTTFKTN